MDARFAKEGRFPPTVAAGVTAPETAFTEAGYSARRSAHDL